MQIYECRKTAVRRDMDLTRELLLKLEADKRLDGTAWLGFSNAKELGIKDHTDEEVGYHLDMLIESGFVKGSDRLDSMFPAINKLTWQGHELLDDIRDDTVWGNAKERAKGLGGVGIQLMWELAKAEIKHKLGLM